MLPQEAPMAPVVATVDRNTDSASRFNAAMGAAFKVRKRKMKAKAP